MLPAAHKESTHKMAKRCGFYARQTNYARVHNNKKMHSGLVSVDGDVLIIPPPYPPLRATFPDHPRRLATLMKPAVLLFAPFYSRGERFGSGRRRVGANFLRSALVSAAADRSLVALRLTASHSSSSSGSNGSTSKSTCSGAKNKSERARRRKREAAAVRANS